jgi:hypothetical protein
MPDAGPRSHPAVVADAPALARAEDQGVPMGQDSLAALELAESAGSIDLLPRRGEQALDVLRLAGSTRAFLPGPTHARELEPAGTTGRSFHLATVRSERAGLYVPPRVRGGWPR